MGKKVREKDGHKRENNQIEEDVVLERQSDFEGASTGNMDDVPRSMNRDVDRKKRKEDNGEKKKDRIKKRKLVFDADGEESHKAQKKHKKSKDGTDEVKEASRETCSVGKENVKQESSKEMYLENTFEFEAKRVRKAKHKNKNKDRNDAVAIATEDLERSEMQEVVGVQNSCRFEDINKMVHGKDGEFGKNKKKKKQKPEKVGGDLSGCIAVMSSMTDGNETNKKKSKSQKTGSDGNDHASFNGIEDQEVACCNGKEDSAWNEAQCRGGNVDVGNAEDVNRGSEKKKSKSVKGKKEGKHLKADSRTRKSVNTTNESENATPKERSKRVSFSDQVEVFPHADVTDADQDGKEGLVYGRRYSKEEDTIIMDAVANYVESHNLGDDGIHMIMNCHQYPEIRNCWNEIQAAIPWRPKDSVYRRGHVLFERDEKRRWTPEEYELIQKFVEKHGPKWKMLGDALGKHRHHVKDTWRRIRLTNKNRGHWSQQEYQSLFDLVNLDLSMKAFEEKKSKHGMLRDNICWTAISDKMETRDFVHCCKKWYYSLTSPMVAEGIWGDADDYRMLDALSSLDACCMEDVDWDNLLEHRSGDLCRKRWNQMVQHIGPHGDQPFNEQVEIMSKRYRPDMVDAREAIDSKQPVDLP
ncbi:hypothetical protein COLO4_18286 [Corchorus olitorius]|uniref:Myb-like domain-containing protein n=1 Tax=Corchorus olitorius TaxID=93759 RepID=A0A1R3J9T6_9ROSI|nr:hypothetical protein COLO4_18286 [Corchorus olitorius]